MLGRVKLGNTLLTCDQGNFNGTLVTVVRDTCTIIGPTSFPSPLPPSSIVWKGLKDLSAVTTFDGLSDGQGNYDFMVN